MRIVFFGSPDFAVPSLEALYSHHDVILVVTRTDKPAGRGKKVSPPPVKSFAQELGLKVIQTDKISDDLIEAIVSLRPDLCVVNAFGLFLSKKLRKSSGNWCINVHPSMLPRYRGAAPIQRAIINGEKSTGVTIMHVAGKLDAGDIILQEEVPILYEDTAETLSLRLAQKGAQLLVKAIELLEQGTAPRIPQDEGLATWAEPLKKEDGRIDWSWPAEKIRDLVRGVVPWPGAYTGLPDGRTLKVWPHVEVRDGIYGMPGTVLEVKPEVIVAAGRGGVLLGDVQLPGKKRVPAKALVNGGVIVKGDRFA